MDSALDAVNFPGRTRLARVSKWTAWLVLVGIVFLAGVLAQAAIGGWWNQRKLDQQNLYLTFRILQYNLEQHTLLMPPDVVPQAQPAPAKPTGPPDPGQKH